MQHKERSTDSNASGSDVLGKKTRIEFIYIQSAGEGDEDAECEVSSTTKTNGQSRKQLRTVFKLKADKEHLLKKVQQITHDTDQEKKILTEELEFYKRYYKERRHHCKEEE